MDGEKREGSMTPHRMTLRAMLRVLIIGLSLVMALLLVTGIVGVGNMRAIEASASRVAREQRVTARLIADIQAEQLALNAVLLRLTRDPETIDSDDLLKRLDETDSALRRIASSASGGAEETLWRQLQEASAAFSKEARRMIDEEDSSAKSLRALFQRQIRVVRLVGQIVTASTARVVADERNIAVQSTELVNESLFLLGSCLVLSLLGAVFTVRLTSRAFRTMEWQASELSRVSWHMLAGQEAAARRFSHELHDELGQSLTALKANLVSLNLDSLEHRRNDCIHLVDEAISNVRELSQLLRPVILDDFGLDASLRWLVEKFTMRTGIQVDFQSNLSYRLGEETETHLFRIAQEALTNIARHSGAKHARIEIKSGPERVEVTVRDDGKGLANHQQVASTSLGMVGMRARARHAGGELTLHSPDDGGLEVQVWVPASRRESVAEQEDPHSVSR